MTLTFRFLRFTGASLNTGCFTGFGTAWPFYVILTLGINAGFQLDFKEISQVALKGHFVRVGYSGEDDRSGMGEGRGLDLRFISQERQAWVVGTDRFMRSSS